MHTIIFGHTKNALKEASSSSGMHGLNFRLHSELRKFDKYCQVIDHAPVMLAYMNLLMGGFHSDAKS